MDTFIAVSKRAVDLSPWIYGNMSRIKLHALSGNAEAMGLHGTLLASIGQVSEAARFFQKSGRLGNTRSAWNAGTMLELGIGVGRNTGKAARFFKIAGDAGDREASLRAALLLVESGKETTARRLLKVLSREQDPIGIAAKLAIGTMYLTAPGRSKRTKLGLAYIVKAARLGHPQANYILGDMRSRNYFRREDALSYFRVAAESGHDDAPARIAAIETALAIPARFASSRPVGLH